MSLKIIGTRLSTPSDPGFPDKCRLEDEKDGMILFQTLRFGTNPNPFNEAGAPWETFSAQLGAGSFEYEFIQGHKKFGDCLLLNRGGPCRITRPNPNPKSKYRGQYFASEVFMHSGFRPDKDGPGPDRGWRGSLACQTVYPDEKDVFFRHFKKGDKGIYVLIDGTIHQ
jgi:hypothetical protein